jgi:hypothetical protein
MLQCHSFNSDRAGQAVFAGRFSLGSGTCNLNPNLRSRPINHHATDPKPTCSCVITLPTGPTNTQFMKVTNSIHGETLSCPASHYDCWKVCLWPTAYSPAKMQHLYWCQDGERRIVLRRLPSWSCFSLMPIAMSDGVFVLASIASKQDSTNPVSCGCRKGVTSPPHCPVTPPLTRTSGHPCRSHF